MISKEDALWRDRVIFETLNAAKAEAGIPCWDVPRFYLSTLAGWLGFLVGAAFEDWITW